MRNEVGEAFVAPVYQALVDRGVKFHFFPRGRDIVPGQDESGAPVVERIELEPQRDADDYDPLATHQGTGRKYWPAEPKDASATEEPLESFWARDSGRRISLRRRGAGDAQGFDDVVFA